MIVFRSMEYTPPVLVLLVRGLLLTQMHMQVESCTMLSQPLLMTLRSGRARPSKYMPVLVPHLRPRS